MTAFASSTLLPQHKCQTMLIDFVDVTKNTIELTSFRSWSLRCLSLIVFCWSATFLLLFFLWRNPVRYSLYVNKGQTSITATITNLFLFGKQHHNFIPSKEASYNLWRMEVGTYWRALSSNTATECLFLRKRLPMWCPPRATSPSSSSISLYTLRGYGGTSALTISTLQQGVRV